MGRVIFLAGLACLGCLVFGFVLGLAYNAKAVTDKVLREAGMSRETGKLFARAVKIMRRMSGLAALDGELSGDMLSPTSRTLITGWLDDYRKLAERGDPGTVSH